MKSNDFSAKRSGLLDLDDYKYEKQKRILILSKSIFRPGFVE